MQDVLYLTYTGNFYFWNLLPGREMYYLGRSDAYPYSAGFYNIKCSSISCSNVTNTFLAINESGDRALIPTVDKCSFESL
jgi:hypothetical protein